MIQKLNNIWNSLEEVGISRREILNQAWLVPARCCLINSDGHDTVESSFKLLKEVAEYFKAEIKNNC